MPLLQSYIPTPRTRMATWFCVLAAACLDNVGGSDRGRRGRTAALTFLSLREREREKSCSASGREKDQGIIIIIIIIFLQDTFSGLSLDLALLYHVYIRIFRRSICV